MKVVICGSRYINDFNLVEKAISESGFVITEVVSGCASGVDTMGEKWAKLNNIPVAPFPAQWGTHGRSAGPIRNIKMAEYAEAVIAIWDGSSRGTKHMVEAAKARGLKVYLSIV